RQTLARKLVLRRCEDCLACAVGVAAIGAGGIGHAQLTRLWADPIVLVTMQLPRSFAARRAAAFRVRQETSMPVIPKIMLAAPAGPALSTAPAAAQKITFTLNWVAGGDHAPYFYAQKMGWYKEAGLDIDFETGRGSAASAQKVGAGSSPLGLSDMG